VEGDATAADYPQRSALIAELCGLWKAARRPVPEQWKNSILDGKGWDLLNTLVDRLARHLSFEHLERRELHDALVTAIRRYKSPQGRQGRSNPEFAAEVLDGLAREPMQRTLYLGVQHLKLPHGTIVGKVRFLLLSEDQALAQSFADFGDAAPEMVCEVEAIGGTENLVRDRARLAAEGALALVRQQVLFGGTYKIYLDQVIFGLDGKYTWREGEGYAGAGWWRLTQPISMDYTTGNHSDWLARLDGLSADYSAAAPGLQDRIDTCVGWLDVAARSDRWQIIIPALFSAMEAILIPERVGLKAGVVTVRSVAVHVALEEMFYDPGQIMLSHSLRSDLVHGTPTMDVPDKEATDFAESRRGWAFNVLRDYLKLAKDIGAATVNDVLGHLDAGPCDRVCAWLEEHGGSAIVAEYRNALAPEPCQDRNEDGRGSPRTVKTL
jgi:hypothetical protein